jgi:hypothetical protein
MSLLLLILIILLVVALAGGGWGYGRQSLAPGHYSDHPGHPAADGQSRALTRP